MQSPSSYIRWCYRSIARWIGIILARFGRLTRTPFCKKTGRWGEHIASRHLRQNGAKVIELNWRAGGLEADIIALELRTIVIVEVKTRYHSLKTRYPAIGAIDRKKRRYLELLLGTYVRNHGPLCRRIGVKRHRVDAVEVYYTRGLGGSRRVTEIRWHRGLPSTFRDLTRFDP